MKWRENLKTRLADQKPTNLIVRIEDMGWPEFIKDQQRRDLAQRAPATGSHLHHVRHIIRHR